MVTKQPCPKCKGNRYIDVPAKVGHVRHAKCPECAGQGFKIKITR